MPSGIKSYFYQYRTREGRLRCATIGKHGEWTPTQARAKAEDYREAVRGGCVPLADKRTLKEAPTVGEILDAYLASESFKDKATSTQAIDRGRIERHLRSLLGRRHAYSLSAEDIKRAFNSIRDDKTAKDVKTRKCCRARVTGGSGTARMSINLLRTIFNWAGVKPNPCDGLKTGTSGTRETILEESGDGASALSKAWRKVRTEANLPATLGLHGLRHLVASHLAMSGAQAPEIMTAMGHRQLSTVLRYIHFAEDARKTIAEREAEVALAGDGRRR